MDQTHFRKDESFSIPIRKSLKVRNKMITKKRQKKTTFQDSMRVTLIFAQVFSLMPISGVMSNNSSDIRFTFLSWKFVYWLLSFLGQMFLMLMCVQLLMQSGVNLNSIGPLIYNCTVCYTVFIYFKIARSWPALVQYISHTEDLNPNFDNKLAMKCNMTSGVMVILTLLEHILFNVAAVAIASVCYHYEIDSYEILVQVLFPSIFDVLPYSPILGLLVQILYFQSTFIKEYCDLFVICISYYLISRLEQINKKLKAARGKYLPEIFWRSTREEYYRATELVRKVDDVISGITFISFTNNLICICVQLFNTLQDGFRRNETLSGCSNKNTMFNGYQASTFFVFSLVHLFTKWIAVSLTASRINTASLFPATVLYEVPSPVYCVEVERFLDQVNGSKVALTGLQFFSVTRGLLLTVVLFFSRTDFAIDPAGSSQLHRTTKVASTIVTYELVMFQFNLPVHYNFTDLFFPNTTTSLIP